MQARSKEPVKIPTPRVLLPIGDPERDRGTVYYIKRTWEHTLCTITDWKKALDGLESEKVWERYPPDNPYGSLDALLKAEIGFSVDESILEAHKRTLKLGQKADTMPELNSHGGDRKSEEIDQPDVCKVENPYGNSATYRARKLKRDHADVFRRMLEGEFASVAQAEEAAGIKKPNDRWNAPQDIIKLAIAIKKRFLTQQIQQLKDLL